MSFFSRLTGKDVGAPKEGCGISWKAVVIWLLCLLPALLILLNNNSVLQLRHERRILSGISHESGFGYIVSIDPGWVDWDDAFYSDTIALENGKPLAFQDYYSVDVRNIGNGRYNILENRVFLSSSDNTDPRANGRVYEIDGTLKFSRGVVWIFYSLAAVATLAFIILYRERLKPIFANPPLYALVSFLIVIFLMTRLWFFIDYPLPGFWGDTGSYFEAINFDGWPLFAIRPPLFPMFLKCAYFFVDRVMAVIALQNVLSLVAAAFLVYAVHRVKSALSMPAAIAMAGWLTGFGPIEYDISLLSESLYSAVLLFLFGSLLLGIYKKRAFILALSSATMALAILTRPAGMYLIVIYLMILAFLFWMRYSGGKLVAFAIPFPALLLSLCLYNYLTVKVFAISAFGGANLAGVTLVFWEQDSSYPARINDGIAKVQAAMEKRGEYIETIRTSSNPSVVDVVNQKGYGAPQYPLAMNLDVGDWSLGARDKWLTRISVDAIKKHPDLYAKVVKSMLINFFINVGTVGAERELVEYLKSMARFLNIDKRPEWLSAAIAREYATPVNLSAVSVIGSGANAQIVIKPTPLWRVYRAVNALRNFIFAKVFWSYIFFIVFFISVVMLIKSKAQNKGAFFLFTMTSAVIGAAMIVSLAEASLSRYSYPTEFIYYLSLVLLPLIFMKDGRGAEKEE